MTQRTFTNLNLGFYNPNSLGEGYLTKANYGTVWTCEYSCTNSRGLNTSSYFFDLFYKCLRSTNSSSVFYEDYWKGVTDTFTLTIQLLGDYTFPDDILSQIKVRVNVPPSNTATECNIEDTGLTSIPYSYIATSYIQKQLVNNKKLILSVKPSTVNVSGFANRKCCVFWAFTQVDGGPFLGIPYSEHPTGFTGDDNTTNMTVTGLKPEYADGETAEIELTDNTLYHSFDTPFIQMNDTSIPFTFVDDKWTVSFNVTSNFTINGTAKRAIRFIDKAVTGITFDKPLNTYIDVSGVSTSNPFRIIGRPNERFYINGNTNHPYLRTLLDDRINFLFVGEVTHVDYITIRFTNILDEWGTDFEIFAQASYTYDNYGFVAAYNPTNEQMLELADKRFYNIAQGEFSDYSSYIISIHKLHINPDVIPVWVNKTVKYGKFNTTIDCRLFPDTIIELNCGSFTINELYHNRLDYEQTRIEAYLPFIGFVELDVNKFMGNPTYLKYRINVFDGSCLAIFESSSARKTTQQIFEGNVSMKLPIRSSFEQGININQLDENVYYLMNTYTPFIDVTTNMQYESNNNTFGHDENSVGLLSTFSGYCVFSDVNLNMSDSMTMDEYNDVLNILKSGVIL